MNDAKNTKVLEINNGDPDVDDTQHTRKLERNVREPVVLLSTMTSTQQNLRERVAEAWRRFYDWKTEHQFLGRYSVDKLQQFDRYQSSASLWRCLGVITILSLVPAFGLVVGLHAIPVNSPDLGIKHNTAAGVRSAIGYAVLTTSWVFCIRQSLGSSKKCHPVKTFVLSTLVGGLLPEGLWSIVSLLWRYPTPGSTISKMTMTFGCIFFVSRFSQTKDSRTVNKQRMRAITIVVTEYLLVVTFCLLLALAFIKAPWGVQLALIVIQPPLRSLIKRRTWVHARKLGDLSTDVTVNIVDISSCMYQALCIQYARNAELAALIMVIELFLGLAVAHTYSRHTFIVDGYRTLQTAIKIVEGSLSSTLVVEEDEIQIEELAHPDENLPKAVEEIATTEIQGTESPQPAQWLQRASSDMATINSQRLTGSPNALNQPASKGFSTVVGKKLHRVLSDPARGNANLQPQSPQSARSNAVQYDQQSRRISSFDTVNGTSFTKHQRLHRQMTSTARESDRVLQSRELSLSPKNVNLLRRTASDTIPDRKIDQEIFGHRTSAGSNVIEPRIRSWARDPAKVHCFVDLPPEVTPISLSPKQRSPPQSLHSSRDLPPLTDLHGPEEYGRLPPLRRSTSVFLTPRTLMKHGSKRLLDLGRSTGRQSGYTLAGIGEHPQKSSMNDVRKPSQVNIDGMLVVRKDQARILEQTLQLLFSCEVLVVAEFMRVLVPFLQGVLLAAVWTLPSARYNILLRDLFKEQILEKTVWCLCFSAFELPALAMVCVTVYKKYGISPLHLLAFLLEQQYANFQAKLTTCFIALTFSTSVHQGMEWASTSK